MPDCSQVILAPWSWRIQLLLQTLTSLETSDLCPKANTLYSTLYGLTLGPRATATPGSSALLSDYSSVGNMASSLPPYPHGGNMPSQLMPKPKPVPGSPSESVLQLRGEGPPCYITPGVPFMFHSLRIVLLWAMPAGPWHGQRMHPRLRSLHASESWPNSSPSWL